jgi:sulfide:quinone oxidoreductase
MPSDKDFQILIVGGGCAGITVASSLRRRGDAQLDIGIIEPSEVHYYQPAFTLVGAGKSTLDKLRRKEQYLIPKGVEWVRDSVNGFDPEHDAVVLKNGRRVTYEYLVVCPGLELNWEKIAGAKESLGRHGVCSNYDPDYIADTWDSIQHLKPGAKALFTQAPLPFKCPGAPQKIAYLAADYLRKKGILEKCEVHFYTHAPVMFAVPLFARELVKVAARYGIHVHFQRNLVAVDGNQRKAIFEAVGEEDKGKKFSSEFDMIHITPPQSPPAAVRNSPLANAAGYVDLNQNSLQHIKYKNVFGLGDAGSTPNSKTAAAIRKQAPVVVTNLLASMNKDALDNGYDGYASCPLTTAYGKVIMAEFIYGGKVTPTFPLDPRKERLSYWWIKTIGLPLMYWYYMLKGYEKFFEHRTGYEPPAD